MHRTAVGWMGMSNFLMSDGVVVTLGDCAIWPVQFESFAGRVERAEFDLTRFIFA